MGGTPAERPSLRPLGAWVAWWGRRASLAARCPSRTPSEEGAGRTRLSLFLALAADLELFKSVAVTTDGNSKTK